MKTHATCTALYDYYLCINGVIPDMPLFTALECVSVLQSVLDESTTVSPVQGLEYGFLFTAQDGDVHKLEEFLVKGCSLDVQDTVSHIHGVLLQHRYLADMACSFAPVRHCAFS